MPNNLIDLDKLISGAVAHYWSTRKGQAEKQAASGRVDQGARSAVTGGAHMDGFLQIVTGLIVNAGVSSEHIFYNRSLELPGFFRPTKEWDLLVVRDGQLVMALEVKSQVGPSFGNNFNNRTEEAIGSAWIFGPLIAREHSTNHSDRGWGICFSWKILQLHEGQ